MKAILFFLSLLQYLLVVASLGVALFTLISAGLFAFTGNSIFAGWALVSCIFSIPAALFVAHQ